MNTPPTTIRLDAKSLEAIAYIVATLQAKTPHIGISQAQAIRYAILETADRLKAQTAQDATKQ